MAGCGIQTSGLAISPNYQGNSQVPVSYGVSESLTATLNNLSHAGGQIEAAVHAGGNPVTNQNLSPKPTDTGNLLAPARVAARRDSPAQGPPFPTTLPAQ